MLTNVLLLALAKRAAIVLLAISLASLGHAEDLTGYPGPKHEEVPGEHDHADNGPPFPASGVTLLGWMKLQDFPGAPERLTDIWAYVSPSGREYALVGLDNGTAFVEVTNPANPTLIGVFAHNGGSCCSDVKVFGHYAYSVTEGGGGVRVFDMSAIDDGIIASVITFSSFSLHNAHNIAINEESGYAYLCGATGNDSAGGLFVLDLSDPPNPSFAGVWAGSYVHDAQVVTYTEGEYAGREIAFAYCASSPPLLRIIDVTDKANMVEIGSTDYPNATYTHQGWLSEDRQFVYLNDEFDELESGIPTSTIVLSVRDLTNPHYATTILTGSTSTDHNLVVVGDILYLANYTSGLRIFSVKKASFAHELGYFDTHPADDDVGFGGAWGVYASLPSGNILVSDMENGLFVLDVSEALANVAPMPSGRPWTSIFLGSILLALGLLTLRSAYVKT